MMLLAVQDRVLAAGSPPGLRHQGGGAAVYLRVEIAECIRTKGRMSTEAGGSRWAELRIPLTGLLERGTQGMPLLNDTPGGGPGVRGHHPNIAAIYAGPLLNVSVRET